MPQWLYTRGMILEGNRTIAAGRQVVWDALNDPEVLARAIPGCNSLTGSPETGFEASVTQKIGPVKATFKGSVTISEAQPPVSYRLSGAGKGGAAGFASGSALVTLDEVAEGTRLVYAVEARVGGKLASLGGRLITGVARKLADRFFENFEQIVAPETAEVADG